MPYALCNFAGVIRATRHIMAAILAVYLAATMALAGASGASSTRLVSGLDAAGWQAVGRLEVNNLAYCTGVLIAPDVVMTAAHCLFDPRTKTPVRPGDVVFQADLRNGRASATLRGNAYVIHPDFDYDGATQSERVTKDLALVRLDRRAPVDFNPFPTGQRPRKGSDVAVVSYGMGRAETPVLEEGCTVLARRSGMLVLNCDVEFGSSGAPVFQQDISGRMQVVSVISSAIDLKGTRYALGTDLQRPLATLNALLADLPDSPQPGVLRKNLPRVRQPDAPKSGGAKFLRP